MRARRLNHRGSLLIEVSCALAILAVVGTVGAQWSLSIHKQQQSIAVRRYALEELTNLLEMAALLPWESLTEERLQQLATTLAEDSGLPGARCEVDLEQLWEPLPAKRVEARMTWIDRNGLPSAPVRLGTWFYATGDVAANSGESHESR